MPIAKFRIGIGEDSTGKELSTEFLRAAIREAKKIVATNFGGYTITPATGGWVNPEGRLVEGSALVIETFTDHGRELVVTTIAEELARLFKQQSVATSITCAQFQFVAQRKEVADNLGHDPVSPYKGA